jgi:5-methylcytosine-specific restriction endonuclease McrA
MKRVSEKQRAKLAAYTVTRLEVADRDKRRCRVCGRRATDTHHILYRSQGGPDEPWNLICLCRACHELVHREGPAVWRTKLHAMVLS